MPQAHQSGHPGCAGRSSPWLRVIGAHRRFRCRAAILSGRDVGCLLTRHHRACLTRGMATAAGRDRQACFVLERRGLSRAGAPSNNGERWRGPKCLPPVSTQICRSALLKNRGAHQARCAPQSDPGGFLLVRLCLAVARAPSGRLSGSDLFLLLGFLLHV